MAYRQLAAKGRQGRTWEMPHGNLAATLLTFPNGTAAEAARMSFVASLATADLLGSMLPGAEIRLKWPNDVLLNGGKAAGILLESASRGQGVAWLAVGIGVNLAASPELGELAPGAFPPTNAQKEGAKPIAPEDALTRLAVRFAYWAQRLRVDGFPTIRAAWLARAARLGERIEARLPETTHTGIFEDIDADGALVLRTPNGQRLIAAADVFFPE